MQIEDKKFIWTKKKRRVAELMGEGTKTQQVIAVELDVHESSICRWKRHPEFLKYVDKCTLDHELATQAGILRALYKGANIKEGNIEGDKTSFLDFVKEIAEIMQMKKNMISGDIGFHIIYDDSELNDENNQD